MQVSFPLNIVDLLGNKETISIVYLTENVAMHYNRQIYVPICRISHNTDFPVFRTTQKLLKRKADYTENIMKFKHEYLPLEYLIKNHEIRRKYSTDIENNMPVTQPNNRINKLFQYFRL